MTIIPDIAALATIPSYGDPFLITPAQQDTFRLLLDHALSRHIAGHATIAASAPFRQVLLTDGILDQHGGLQLGILARMQCADEQAAVAVIRKCYERHRVALALVGLEEQYD